MLCISFLWRRVYYRKHLGNPCFCCTYYYHFNHDIYTSRDKDFSEDDAYSKLKMEVLNDEYLRVLYGDYMKLPPEDQRENHHNFHLADVNKSFREYQEKI